MNLAILQDTDIVLVERIIGSSFSNLDHKVGTRIPAYCTSLGRCILAFMDPKKAEEIIERSSLKQLTTHTITDKAKLLEEIERARQRGYAACHQQLALGWYNVAVPIVMGDLLEGALGISYPLDFFESPQRENALLKDLIQIGKDASFATG